MKERLASERGVSVGQIGMIGVLTLLLAILLGIRFTLRTDADKERARARVLLQTLHQLEEAYHKEHGTYLSVDSERNSDVLKLNDLPGSLHLTVEATESTFVAFVEADPAGSGATQTWRIDSRHSEPELLQSRSGASSPEPTTPP